MPFVATWAELEMIILSEVSQTQNSKYHMISLICGMLKKKVQMNLFTKQKQSHRCRKQQMQKTDREGGGGIN